MTHLADLRIALRSLRRAPATALAAVITLALGIALSTTVFSIVYGVFIKGLPFHDPERIMVIQPRNRLTGETQSLVPTRNFIAYRTATKSFSAMAAYVEAPANISFGGRAERFAGAAVTANSFSLLGVPPAIGRDFTEADGRPGAPPLAILSFELWNERFGGATSLLGKTVRIDGEPRTVIGVMPHGFRFPQNDAVWTNLVVDESGGATSEAPLAVWGRLRSNVSLAPANAEISAVARRAARDRSQSDAMADATVLGWIDGELGPLRQLMYAMLCAALCVLLIGCANTANLLLVRAIGRTKQTGIRLALGASQFDVAKGVTIESLVIGVAASAVGLCMAALCVGAFKRAIVDTNPPFYIDIALNSRVFGFTALAGILASALVSLLPIRQSAKLDINQTLKDGTRGAAGFRSGRASRPLVIGGLALSCALLVAAGLMTKSIVRLATLSYGFETNNILTGEVRFAAHDDAEWRRLTTTLDDALRSSRGVEAVALSSSLPGIGTAPSPVSTEGASVGSIGQAPAAAIQFVSSGFFDTYGVRVVTGRLIDRHDNADARPVAVISDNLAARLFPSGSAVGKRIRAGAADTAWKTIVGVVPAVYSGDARHPFRERVYLPLLQASESPLFVAVRARGAMSAVAQSMRDATSQTSMDAALTSVETMAGAVARPMWKLRVFGGMFVAFGALALFLGALGLYTVLSFGVASRRAEIGIRMALGARTADVVALVVRTGMVQLAIGLAIGLCLALAAAHFLALLLFGVQPRDLEVFGSVAVVLAVTGIAASAIPAWNATRIDPVSSIRIG